MRLAPLLPAPAPPQPELWQHPPALFATGDRGSLVELAPRVRVLAEHDDEHPHRWLPAPPAGPARAACRGMDQVIFYGSDCGDAFTLGRAELAAAQRICGGCPVRADCLEYALSTDERYGVYGGQSGRGRERLRAR